MYAFVNGCPVVPQVPAGDGLTVEEEQTADELLADIQSAVDEMLHDFQATSLSPDSNSPATSFPPPSHTSSVDNVGHLLYTTSHTLSISPPAPTPAVCY